MAKHQKSSIKSVNPKNSTKKAKVDNSLNSDLLDIININLKKNQRIYFWIFFAFSILFSLLLFDLRVSVGGDDTTYILKAQDFIKDFKYPSFQGPLYPIVLSPFIVLFGINLTVLKFVSFVFLCLNLFVFYKAFKDKIPNLILIGTVILISINPYLLFYGSQTYSEAFFLLAQSFFFIWFFKNFISDDTSQKNTLSELVRFLIMGLILLGLGLIKSVGYGAILVVIIYFLFEKKWKYAGFSFVGFGIVLGLWQFLKFLVWGDSKAQMSDQAASLLLKHPYDPSQGTETFFGFVQRFFDNSNIYLSRQFLKILGLRPELIKVNGGWGAVDTIPLLAVLVYVVFIAGFLWAIWENKYLKFAGIYLAVMLGITFVILQSIWEAHRLIIPFLPLMIMFLIAGFYGLFKTNKYKEISTFLKPFQFILPILFIIMFFSTFQRSTSKIKEHQEILNAHLRGNITAGFTQDWVNFINMSIYAAKTVPPDKVIASRKPSISSIYGNRRFFGIYSVESTDPDTLLNYLHKHKVEYVIMASLRKNEAQKTDQIINTIQRYLYFIQLKYPEKIKLIYQLGLPDDEPAYLFKIE